MTPVVATFHTQCYVHKKWGKAARTYLKFGEHNGEANTRNNWDDLPGSDAYIDEVYYPSWDFDFDEQFGEEDFEEEEEKEVLKAKAWLLSRNVNIFIISLPRQMAIPPAP